MNLHRALRAETALLPMLAVAVTGVIPAMIRAALEIHTASSWIMRAQLNTYMFWAELEEKRNISVCRVAEDTISKSRHADDDVLVKTFNVFSVEFIELYYKVQPASG